ncbi:hypothetical protein PC120_g20975, partial [Phytophthora cactorum]
MVKVTLVCLDVSGGSVNVVDIDTEKYVGHLQQAIAEILKYGGKASDLQLFLAKKADGKWLDGAGLAGVTLDEAGAPVSRDENGTPQCFKKMDPLLWINNDKHFGKNFGPAEGEVHVLVLVPKQGTSVPTVSQDGVFDHCSDPFFSKFQTVDEVNSWLQFPALLPLTERQTLYIRSSYKSIAAQALSKVDPNRRKYAVITGTPGIGKSVFVYYVMWRLIKDRKRVLLFEGEGNFYFDGTTMFTCKALPDKSNLQFWSPDLWCLVDSLDPTSIPGLPYRRCSVLLASTPRRDCIGEFKKLAPTPDVFYMPLWTKEELATIAPMYPHAAAVWENRFECLGGVPRLVLQDIE